MFRRYASESEPIMLRAGFVVHDPTATLTSFPIASLSR